MKKLTKWLVMACLITACLAFCKMPVSASSHKAGEVIYSSWGYKAGTYDSEGQIQFRPCKKNYKGHSPATVNADALQTLCALKRKKTIVIPSGSSVELASTVHINSNTTIIATGADIYISKSGSGVLNNLPTAVNYQSIENVIIDGGTWRTTDKTHQCTVIRLCHGKNVAVKNAKVVGNYQSHCIELIAMKKTTIEGCRLTVQGKKDKNSVEEALQIDVASPTTAPGLLATGTFHGTAYGGTKYVQGQTCKNIKVLNCYIKGSRGLCANYTEVNGQKIKNKFHDKITIQNCTLIGTSAEGCTLYNTLRATVTDNTIRTTSTRRTRSYSVGLNITIQGVASASMMKKSNIVVMNNKVKGYRQGIQIVSRSSSRYQKTTVKNNVCYATNKANALLILSVNSVKKSGNKLKTR